MPTDFVFALKLPLVAAVLVIVGSASAAAATCEAIKTMPFADTTVSVAEVVQSGSFVTPPESEQNIPAQSTIDYYERVVDAMGGRSRTFVRLFVVPGMQHCFGGENATDQFDRVSFIERWVEQGIAPDRILAAT